MPDSKKKQYNDGQWMTVPEDPSAPKSGEPTRKGKRVFKVTTVRGRQEQAWLDTGMWQPREETIIPEIARSPLTTMKYGTYGSDGLRHDGSPGGAYSSVFDRYAMQGGDLYTRDEARALKQWDTRKPFPGFDPKLGSKTLDIYSED